MATSPAARRRAAALVVRRARFAECPTNQMLERIGEKCAEQNIDQIDAARAAYGMDTAAMEDGQGSKLPSISGEGLG